MKKALLSFSAIVGLLFALTTPAISGFFGNKDKKMSDDWNQLRHAEIKVNGQTRSFEYFVPKTTTNKTLPVIIALHGGGGSGNQMAKSSELVATARKHNIIMVFPNGSGKKQDALLTWNAEHCCGYAMNNNVDDINFISQTIDYTINYLGADANRVYITGISNGAMMTQRAAISLGHKITAIAPVVGTLFGDEPNPKIGVPSLILTGAIDDHIPLNGGQPPKNAYAWDGTPMKPALYLGQFWAKANNCQLNPAISNTPTLTYYSYSCPKPHDVTQVIVKDGGHEWFGGKAGRPGKDSPSKSFDTNEEITRFFLSRSK